MNDNVPFALVPMLFLAGCLSDAPRPGAMGEGPCEESAIACEDLPDVITVRLTGCQIAPMYVDLREEAFELPPPFVSRASATSPQRLTMDIWECQEAQDHNGNYGPVGLARVSVLVEPVGRGVEADVEAFVLETIVDSEELSATYQAASFETLNGTMTIEDMGSFQSAQVRGDVDYSLTGQKIPVGDAVFTAPTVEISLVRHDPDAWFFENRACKYYFGTAPMALTEANGAAAAAMPPAGPLVRDGSQGFECDLTLKFRPVDWTERDGAS